MIVAAGWLAVAVSIAAAIPAARWLRARSLAADERWLARDLEVLGSCCCRVPAPSPSPGCNRGTGRHQPGGVQPGSNPAS